MSDATAERPDGDFPGWPIPIAPARAQGSAMAGLMDAIAGSQGIPFADYPAFHAWSCREYPTFWSQFLATLDLPLSGSLEPACTGQGVAGTRFFPGLRLNVAQCLLRRIDDATEQAPALILRTEQGARVSRTRAGLRDRCLRLAGALREAGVAPGDRIVAIGRNSPELVEAFVASAAVGATWSSVSPDLGVDAVLSRFGELGASVAFVDLRHVHHGQVHDTTGALREILPALASLRLVVTLHDHPSMPADMPTSARIAPFDELLAGEALVLERLAHFAFDHPLCILFTSGTTGKPKCLVHGAGGTLLEHLKEHRLHAGFGPHDRLLFYTTCGWMMWNWMVSGLASAMPLVIYDGSATFPTPDALLEVLADERVTVFGTSPAYLQMLQNLQIEPRANRSLERLRTIQSTGSVLHPHQFDWIRESFGAVAIE
ncbi:MAG: AMP-binding protein [Burkholderiaceae bacterium]